jgi:hypothetical protein
MQEPQDDEKGGTSGQDESSITTTRKRTAEASVAVEVSRPRTRRAVKEEQIMRIAEEAKRKEEENALSVEVQVQVEVRRSHRDFNVSRLYFIVFSLLLLLLRYSTSWGLGILFCVSCETENSIKGNSANFLPSPAGAILFTSF